MSHYQYSNIEELFKLANDSSVPQSRPGSSNPAHPGESAGLPLGSWPGSIPQSLEDPHIGNSEPSFGRVSPASTPLPASLKEDETLDERESSGANSKRNAVTSLPGNPKRARLDATDTPGASTRARPDSGARDRGSFSAPNMAKGGTPTANGTKRSGDSNWRSTGTLRAALPDRHFGSGKKPAASFYSDFLDLLNPSPSPKTPSSKPKKLVALSKRSLNTYQFREEINAEALRTQVAANQALIQLKKDESAEVEYANKLREANVNEAKSNQPQQRRGVANQPGNGANFFEVVYPGQKRQWRKFSKDLFTYTEDQVNDVAEREEVLVPIRIDAEANGYRVKDTFTWNMNDPLVNPTSFAEVLCEDLHISDSEGLVPIIVQQIIRQVEDYRKHAPMALFERVQLSQGREGDQGGGDVWADNAGDLRIPVQLNVVVDKVHLHDQFEWDVTCWRNSPETFADIVTREERLEPEFRTAIAHQIREQVHQFSKSLMQVGYAFDGSPIADEEVAETVLPPLGPGARTVLRDPAARPQYGPILIELLPDELERLDKEHVKEPKRKRRGGRGRRAAAAAGSQAPERETPLTMRTSLTAPAPNVVRNAARGNGQSQSNNAAAAASDASGNRRGRRAAAVAATQATAAMLAADRALDRAEREGRGIDDDEESDDDDDDSEGRPPTRQFIARAPGPPFPVARSGAQFPASARPKDPASAAYSEGVNEWELPTWLQTALNRLRSHHQNDMFTIAKRPRTPQDPPNAPEETFLRIRCHDCPGRQYALGPQLSLTNFEVHLNNRNHRQSVANRLSGLASN